jgi:hypothetical protein
MRVRKRCNWVKSLNGRLRGLRLSRSRKFFSTVLFSSRIVRIYNEVVNRIMNMESSYPVIVLPTQWGLPVLSHPSRGVMVSSNRKVIFYSLIIFILFCSITTEKIHFHSCYNYSLIELAFIHLRKINYVSKNFIRVSCFFDMQYLFR